MEKDTRGASEWGAKLAHHQSIASHVSWDHLADLSIQALLLFKLIIYCHLLVTMSSTHLSMFLSSPFAYCFNILNSFQANWEQWLAALAPTPSTLELAHFF